MTLTQWILIGLAVVLAVVLIIFRKHPWVQKSWKYIVLIAPILLTLGLVLAAKKKPDPQPVPQPIPTPTPSPQGSDSTAITHTTMVIGLDYQLSTHFNYGLLTMTEHRELLDKNRDGGKKYLDHMSKLCNTVLEPLWILMGPYTITSCFRCLALNTALKASKNSQHMVGDAADTVYAGLGLNEAFNKIAFSNIPYSQCIIEFGWIHVGVIDEVLYPGKVGQKFVAYKDNGTIKYNLITKPV